MSSGDRTFHEEQVLIQIGAHHLEIADGKTSVAHVTGHPMALEDPARRGTRADGTRRSVAVGLAVGLWPAVETVSLNTAREASPLGESHGIDPLAHLKHTQVEALTYLILRHVLSIHLP